MGQDEVIYVRKILSPLQQERRDEAVQAVKQIFKDVLDPNSDNFMPHLISKTKLGCRLSFDRTEQNDWSSCFIEFIKEDAWNVEVLISPNKSLVIMRGLVANQDDPVEAYHKAMRLAIEKGVEIKGQADHAIDYTNSLIELVKPTVIP